VTASARTQADRRATTVDALLDATIECLVEFGFAGTSTRVVAGQAGVSQGAQQHYFPTKAALIEAAMYRIMEQIIADWVGRPFTSADEEERLGEVLDRLWAAHNLPVVPAIWEMFNAARTDPEFGPRLMTAIGQGMDAIRSFTHGPLPEYAERPGFDDLVLVVVAAMRGTVMIAAVPGADGLHPSWPTLREHFLRAFTALPHPGSADR
jgi:AcrR family transcriptional regulator